MPENAYTPKPTDPIQIDEDDVTIGGVPLEDDYGVGLPAYVAFAAARDLAEQWNSYPAWQTFNHIEEDIERACASLQEWGRRLREKHAKQPEPKQEISR